MFKRLFIFIFITVLAVRPMFYVGTVIYHKTHINEIVEKYCVNKEKPQLQCNGKCHLAKQLSATNHDDIQNRIDISAAFFPVFYQEIKENTFDFYKLNLKKTSFRYCFDYSSASIEREHKPPIVHL